MHFSWRRLIAELTRSSASSHIELRNCSQIQVSAASPQDVVYHRISFSYSKTERFELKIGEIIHKLIPVQPEHKEEFTRAYRRILEEINRIKGKTAFCEAFN